MQLDDDEDIFVLIGKNVVLNSGGPIMTVIDCEIERRRGITVKCQWISKDGVPYNDTFPLACVSPYRANQ